MKTQKNYFKLWNKILNFYTIKKCLPQLHGLFCGNIVGDRERGKMAEGQVISCHTVETWNEQLQNGKNANKLVSLISFPHLFLFCRFNCFRLFIYLIVFPFMIYIFVWSIRKWSVYAPVYSYFNIYNLYCTVEHDTCNCFTLWSILFC